ncbi:MAG: hypothetical protein M3Z05_04325 [Gemmatimonadota bacterium]|nr:hypothetical protein [Gemmatimonadota bacterium]
MIAPAPPDGYERIVKGRCSVTVRSTNAADARALLAEGTPYEAAARDLAARPLEGRGVAYAIELPASGARVVVRRNRHGGMLAPLTGTLFVAPSRAPYELSVSLRLARAGVRTPEVIMYSVERVHGVFCHADVVTSEIIDSRDLSAYMQAGVPDRDRVAAWSAARALLAMLNAAGARHHDLNVKNILLAQRGDRLVAWVLDVDRVVFGEPGSEVVRQGNAKRLLRSALKWRELRGASFSDEDASLLDRPA